MLYILPHISLRNFLLKEEKLFAVQLVPHSLSGDFSASEIMRSLMSADTTAETKGLCNNLVLGSASDSFHFLYISIYPNHYATVPRSVNRSTGPNSIDRDHLNAFRKYFPGN